MQVYKNLAKHLEKREFFTLQPLPIAAVNGILQKNTVYF